MTPRDPGMHSMAASPLDTGVTQRMLLKILSFCWDPQPTNPIKSVTLTHEWRVFWLRSGIWSWKMQHAVLSHMQTCEGYSWHDSLSQCSPLQNVGNWGIFLSNSQDCRKNHCNFKKLWVKHWYVGGPYQEIPCDMRVCSPSQSEIIKKLSKWEIKMELREFWRHLGWEALPNNWGSYYFS